jgi:hypothetical protein
MTSTPPRAEDSELSGLERGILDLLAVAYAPITRGELCACLKGMGFRDEGGRQYKTGTLEPVLQELQEKRLLILEQRVCVQPQLRDIACQVLLDKGQFGLLAGLVSKHSPLDEWRYGHSQEYRHYLREIRFALYRGDWEESLRLAELVLHREPEAFAWRGPLLQACVLPLRADWFAAVGPEILDPICLDLLEEPAFPHSLVSIQEVIGRQAERPGAPFQLICEWAQYLVLCGELDRASKLVAVQDGPRPLFLAGWIALAKGERDLALDTWEQAHKVLRQWSHKRKVMFSGSEALLWPLALLSAGDSKQVARASKLVDVVLKSSPQPIAVADAIGAAVATLEGIPTPIAPDDRDPRQLIARPVEWLLFRLAALLCDEAPPEGVVARSAELAEQSQAAGLLWLSRELWDVYAREGGEGKPGPEDAEALARVPGVPLGRLFAGRPSWERRFKALISLESKPPPDERPERTAWIIRRYGEEFDLTPRVQKRTKKGWTGGRTVALSRLSNGGAGLSFLSEQDRAVVAFLREQTSGWGRYRDKYYVFAQPGALRALVGHPHLLGVEGQTISLRLAEPRLEVTRDNGRIRLSLEPPRPPRGWSVTEEPSGDLLLLAFNETQERVAKILAEPLELPTSEQPRVVEALASLGQLVEVHSEIGGGARRGEAATADPRPVLQLRRVGVGLSVRARVRPLGAGGPAVVPGDGASDVLATVGGVLTRASRDLAAETRALAELLARSPTLEGLSAEPATELYIDELEGSLDLLLELRDLQSEGRLEWGRNKPLEVLRSSGSPSVTVSSVKEWFSVSGVLKIGEEEVVRLQELLTLSAGALGRFVRLEDGRYLALTRSLVRGLRALHRFGEPRGKGVRFHPMVVPVLEPLLDELGGRRPRALEELRRRIREAETSSPSVPSTLQAELRDYQVEGFCWLARLASWGVGACLADDMGLGKTVQALALLLHRGDDGPALVVAPTSVCANWLEESQRFAPTLKMHLFGPGDRATQLASMGPMHVLVCSYGLLQREAEALAGRRWSTVVLDEAQAIKNPTTHRARATFGLEAGFRVVTTGTPVENRVGEVWSLFRFLLPGFLGSRRAFSERFGGVSEDGPRRAALSDLRKLLRPFVLRRLKSQVLEALPPRTDMVRRVTPTAEEAGVYEALRQAAMTELEGASNSPQQRMRVLAWITRLRLACCDPRLVLDSAGPGAKLAELQELVGELREGGHKALVFSQFVGHLDLLRSWLDAEEIPYCYLDGSTPVAARQEQVKAFQAGRGDLFLISLRAGGTGLNLTAADYVIHMDPWWNPAVEDQASDRAHRIGQTRPVTVYRLVVAGTIEERILDLHQRKRALASELLAGTESATRLELAQLMALIEGGVQQA